VEGREIGGGPEGVGGTENQIKLCPAWVGRLAE
jgi:hypothetical protein